MLCLMAVRRHLGRMGCVRLCMMAVCWSWRRKGCALAVHWELYSAAWVCGKCAKRSKGAGGQVPPLPGHIQCVASA